MMHHFCTLSLCGPCERVLLTSVTTDPVLFKLGGWNMWPGGNSFYDGDCACAKWVVVAVGRCKPINHGKPFTWHLVTYMVQMCYVWLSESSEAMVGVSSTNNSDWTVLRLTCSEAMVVSSNNSAWTVLSLPCYLCGVAPRAWPWRGLGYWLIFCLVLSTLLAIR
jgi:hypothetical protein